MEFVYCPNCKGKLEKKEEYTFCPSCGGKIYHNPTPAVSILPVKEGKVLLARRAIEPYKGDYDVLGGFMDFGETAEEAVRRELKEEVGLEVKSMQFFRTYVDRYGEDGEHTLGLFFSVEAQGEPKASDDVSECEWVKIEDLDKIRSGFKSVMEALSDFKRWYRAKK